MLGTRDGKYDSKLRRELLGGALERQYQANFNLWWQTVYNSCSWSGYNCLYVQTSSCISCWELDGR